MTSYSQAKPGEHRLNVIEVMRKNHGIYKVKVQTSSGRKKNRVVYLDRRDVVSFLHDEARGMVNAMVCAACVLHNNLEAYVVEPAGAEL